tara:strand:+ start:632 stop:1243 length:612 start_codon:yes stop_codon:yes gene_type:complete
MKTIIITGPSASGKTQLAHKLLELFNDSIILKTDSYYRDNFLIRFLSIFKVDIYDKTISLKKNEIKKTLNSLYNKEEFVLFSHYDFKRKQSSQTKIKINYKGDKQFLILEGIFSHRLDINYQETINIVCESDKEICINRRLRRDQLERGRNYSEVNKKFNKSWLLFYKNLTSFINSNQVVVINPVDINSYNNLVINLQHIKNN